MFIRVQTWLIRIRTAPVSLLSQLHITFEQISSCHRRSMLHYWNVLTRFQSRSSINTVMQRLHFETFSLAIFEPRFVILGEKNSENFTRLNSDVSLWFINIQWNLKMIFVIFNLKPNEPCEENSCWSYVRTLR